MGKDIFISYSRKDTAIADRICKALDRAGISYFIDRQGISGGMDFPEVLAQAIVDCKIFLFLASHNSYNSGFTRNEITFACNHKRKMLPYIIDGSTLPLAFEFTFSRINWRTIEEHPIETILIGDLLALLGQAKTSSIPQYISGPQLSVKEICSRGDTAYEAKRYDEAVDWYRKGAEHGNPVAQHNLARAYYYGRGVTRDCAEAVRWFRKAAEHGNKSAQYYLGICYYNGIGIMKDYAEAAKWYRKAAEQGDAYAQYNLGICYYHSKGISRNFGEAVKWFRRAAGQGNTLAKEYIKKLGL